VPPDCCRTDYDAIFDDRMARREASAYRRDGPRADTRRLVEAITAAGVEGATVLDIGGGVGVVGQELLAAGAASLTDVDASRAYLATAQAEITARGWADRATFRFGDFVALAPTLDPADVVTLDRVVCCYPDWEALIDASTAHARRMLGLVYPVDRWWMRAGAVIGNVALRLFRQSFRFHVHPVARIDARIGAAGFVRRMQHRGLVWQVVLYERPNDVQRDTASLELDPLLPVPR